VRKHWLTALREVLKLTQADMARELGVSRARVWQIENTGGSLNGERIDLIWRKHGSRLRGLGYSLSDLLGVAREGNKITAA
jgi:transcriptional regulator with XRE-family HTH domain